MAEINSVVLVGRLTRDAELKYTNSGTAIVRFSLALNRRKKVGESWQDEANFFDVSMMGKGAEGVHKYLTKGKSVGVQGELRQNRWEQDGQPRSKVEVFALNLQLLGDRGGQTNQGPSQNQSQSGEQSGSYQSFSSNGDDHFDDDVPF